MFFSLFKPFFVSTWLKNICTILRYSNLHVLFFLKISQEFYYFLKFLQIFIMLYQWSLFVEPFTMESHSFVDCHDPPRRVRNKNHNTWQKEKDWGLLDEYEYEDDYKNNVFSCQRWQPIESLADSNLWHATIESDFLFHILTYGMVTLSRLISWNLGGSQNIYWCTPHL